MIFLILLSLLLRVCIALHSTSLKQFCKGVSSYNPKPPMYFSYGPRLLNIIHSKLRHRCIFISYFSAFRGYPGIQFECKHGSHKTPWNLEVKCSWILYCLWPQHCFRRRQEFSKIFHLVPSLSVLGVWWCF